MLRATAVPRYAILRHDWPAPHLDLFLEAGPVLRAWRLPAEPQPGADVPADPAADHRLVYLDYEGPVSGGRGSVSRWDAGAFEWEEDAPGRVVVRLHGGRLRGVARITATDAGTTFAYDPEPA